MRKWGEGRGQKSNQICRFCHLFHRVLVFCYQNCSDLIPNVRKSCFSEKLLEFEAEGREFEKNLRSLKQFIQTVKVQNSFGLQNAFLTCSWRFFRSKKLFGYRNLQEELEKFYI